jgi:hypothetical protein
MAYSKTAQSHFMEVPYPCAVKFYLRGNAVGADIENLEIVAWFKAA